MNLGLVVTVYRAHDSVVAHAVLALLTDAGIEARIVGRSIHDIWGPLPSEPDTALKIWVRREDADRALALCRQFDERSESA